MGVVRAHVRGLSDLLSRGCGWRVYSLQQGFPNYAQFLTNYAILLCCIFLSIMLLNVPIMLHLFSHKDCQFYKVQFEMQCKTKEENLTSNQ